MTVILSWFSWLVLFVIGILNERVDVLVVSAVFLFIGAISEQTNKHFTFKLEPPKITNEFRANKKSNPLGNVADCNSQ